MISEFVNVNKDQNLPKLRLILVQMWQTRYLTETPGSWEAIGVIYMYVHCEMAE